MQEGDVTQVATTPSTTPVTVADESSQLGFTQGDSGFRQVADTMGGALAEDEEPERVIVIGKRLDTTDGAYEDYGAFSPESIPDTSTVGSEYDVQRGPIASLAEILAKTMNLSSQAAEAYLRNNPEDPNVKAVSEAYSAVAELLKSAGGVALAFENMPLFKSLLSTSTSYDQLGNSIGSGPQDSANFNAMIQAMDATPDWGQKAVILLSNALKGTSGLNRQSNIEFKQELPGLFLGGLLGGGLRAVS